MRRTLAYHVCGDTQIDGGEADMQVRGDRVESGEVDIGEMNEPTEAESMMNRFCQTVKFENGLSLALVVAFSSSPLTWASPNTPFPDSLCSFGTLVVAMGSEVGQCRSRYRDHSHC